MYDVIWKTPRLQLVSHPRPRLSVALNSREANSCEATGVDGVDLVIGTSSYLRKYSHGKSMETIQATALEVIKYVKSQGVEVRFSSEDSFRSDLVDLLTLYKAVDKAGVNRVSIYHF